MKEKGIFHKEIGPLLAGYVLLYLGLDLCKGSYCNAAGSQFVQEPEVKTIGYLFLDV